MLNSLSRKYKLSKAMLLYSMFKSGRISQGQYNEVLDRYKPAAKKEPEEGGKKQAGFGRSSEDRCVSEMGRKFISLVIANMERGNITQSDALDYLSIKSRNLDKVAGRLKK
jgi:Zn-dependent peptidase ImmA (M78 family)